MSFLFASPAPSYAEEQSRSHLSSLSTLSIAPAAQFSANDAKPSPALEAALHDLSASKVPSHERLVAILSDLAKQREGIAAYANEVDKLVEAEVLGRAVILVWKEVLQALVDGAVQLEEERSWWETSLTGRRGVLIYLVQTLPIRLFSAMPPISSMSVPSLKAISFPSPSTIFKPIHATPTAAISAVTSPYVLTRREMLASRKALLNARDDIARKVGFLALHGPSIGGDTEDIDQSFTHDDLSGETTRVYETICQALQVQTAAPPGRRSRSSHSPPSLQSTANPASLVSILTTHLPRARSGIDRTLTVHKRPSVLTRFWFPLLFLPPAAYSAVQAFARNKEWMKQQVLTARETVKGFVVQWVWEPLEGIGKTIRGGGEGLGVAPTTVQSDQASLERMVMDLGRDYYKLSGPQLDSLQVKVRGGDMEEVLRVYEHEMQSPLKNALLGSLVRTLLIQVQKTKVSSPQPPRAGMTPKLTPPQTDLSLSLLSLDHLLRSQQLTFAFVGVAPSFLILYGLGGYVRSAWKGEKRGKGRRRRYFNGLRDVERILLTAPEDDQEMTQRDRGLLIVSISGMRTWAAGLGSSREVSPRSSLWSTLRGGEADEQPFLDDLRMVEDPALGRRDKLQVVQRIWRCWGVDGRRPH